MANYVTKSTYKYKVKILPKIVAVANKTNAMLMGLHSILLCSNKKSNVLSIWTLHKISLKQSWFAYTTDYITLPVPMSKTFLPSVCRFIHIYASLSYGNIYCNNSQSISSRCMSDRYLEPFIAWLRYLPGCVNEVDDQRCYTQDEHQHYLGTEEK